MVRTVLVLDSIPPAPQETTEAAPVKYSLFEDVLRLDGLMLRERLACELESPLWPGPSCMGRVVLHSV